MIADCPNTVNPRARHELAWREGFIVRLNMVFEEVRPRDVSQACGISTETIRRCRAGSTPSMRLVICLVSDFGVSADWLLLGRGPMVADELPRHHLKQATITELMTALAGRLEHR